MVTNSGLTFMEFNTTNMENIDLLDKPVASICDTDTYKISQSESGLSLSHSIIFKANMKEKYDNSNCNFLLVVDGIRIYKGEY